MWYNEEGVSQMYAAWRVQNGTIPAIPKLRSQVFYHGARVACYPSDGKGIWIKQADPLDLNFLGLSRFEDTPLSSNPTAEDAFCTKLQLLDAEYWTLPPDFSSRNVPNAERYACPTLETCLEPQIKSELLVAWPRPIGVCYIKKSELYIGLDGYQNMLTMWERCEFLSDNGPAHVCTCREECPEPKFAELDWGEREGLCNLAVWEPSAILCTGKADENEIFEVAAERMNRCS